VGDIVRIMGVLTTRGILRSSNQAIMMIGYWEPGTGTGRIIIAKKLPVCRACPTDAIEDWPRGIYSNANGAARRVTESGLFNVNGGGE
jgi:hypothetical protein